MKASTDEDAPWPYFTEKQAATHLGVSPELISGLGNQNDKLRASWVTGKSGKAKRVYNADDVETLRTQLRVRA